MGLGITVESTQFPNLLLDRIYKKRDENGKLLPTDSRHTFSLKYSVDGNLFYTTYINHGGIVRTEPPGLELDEQQNIVDKLLKSNGQ